MARVHERLLLVDIDRRHSRAARPAKRSQGPRFNERRAAGIHEQCCRLHARQVRRGHDPARRVVQGAGAARSHRNFRKTPLCCRLCHSRPPAPAPSRLRLTTPAPSSRMPCRNPRLRSQCGRSQKSRVFFRAECRRLRFASFPPSARPSVAGSAAWRQESAPRSIPPPRNRASRMLAGRDNHAKPVQASISMCG